MNSISRKLLVLFLASMLLVAAIATSVVTTFREQMRVQTELRGLMEIELSIDLIRSQLWVFLQYEDSSAFTQVHRAQKNFTNTLGRFSGSQKDLENIFRMNQSLSGLLEHEKNVVKSDRGKASDSSDLSRKARTLLHSRYNMLVQNMTEEIFFIHQNLLNRSTNVQQQHLFSTAALTLFIALNIALIA